MRHTMTTESATTAGEVTAVTPFPGELTGSIAPMPTARTVRMRTLLPYQAYRFGRVSLKVFKMVRRSHSR
jgi:hypothetical protein